MLVVHHSERQAERDRERQAVYWCKSSKLKCSISPAVSPARPGRGQITECLSSHWSGSGCWCWWELRVTIEMFAWLQLTKYNVIAAQFLVCAGGLSSGTLHHHLSWHRNWLSTDHYDMTVFIIGLRTGEDISTGIILNNDRSGGNWIICEHHRTAGRQGCSEEYCLRAAAVLSLPPSSLTLSLPPSSTAPASLPVQ